MAKFLDLKLKGEKGMSDDDVENVLDKVMVLFRYTWYTRQLEYVCRLRYSMNTRHLFTPQELQPRLGRKLLGSRGGKSLAGVNVFFFFFLRVLSRAQIPTSMCYRLCVCPTLP